MEMVLADLIESSTSYYEITVEVVSLYLTATSGYLIVAYLAGNKLTRSQMIIVSTLYVSIAGLSSYGAIAWLSRATHFARQARNIDATIPFSPNPFLWIIVGLVLFLGIIACLKFMYDVRHPEAE
jgi:H+/Cl- antiporter ClcA